MLALKPSNLGFGEAAAVPAAGVTALQALRDHGRIQAGHRVLINGASGGVGSFAVQIAKSLGADVTGVCSTRNLGRVRALGADQVIDYTQENFTRNGQQYDLIHAANGYHPIAGYKRALCPKGRYVMTGGEMKQFYQAAFLGPWLSMSGNRKFSNMLVKPNQADLIYLRDLIEAGQLRPEIDTAYPLQQVPEAIRHLEDTHAQGKIVIQVAEAD